MLEIYTYLPKPMLPKNFPDIELKELITLKVKSDYVQELKCKTIQKAIAETFNVK